MKLDNFKELLNKKAEDNPNLQLLIKYMKDEYLVDHVVESLSKMARSYSNKRPNSSLRNYAKTMSQSDVDMLYDALSHHASHYKAALNKGNTKLAGLHMKKLFKIINMTEKITRDGVTDHTKGKLKIDAIDPKPWERQRYLKPNKNGELTNTKGFSRVLNDYDYLRGAPHESYKKETDQHGHNQAYPLNEIKVNGKYLHIDDVEDTNEYVSHPFDDHPALGIMNQSLESHTAQDKNEYIKKFLDFRKTKFMDYLKNKANIEGYAERGVNKPDPIHAALPTASEAEDKLKQIMGDDYKAPEAAAPADTEPEVPANEAVTDKPKTVLRKPQQAAPVTDQVSDVEAELQRIMGKDYKPPKE